MSSVKTLLQVDAYEFTREEINNIIERIDEPYYQLPRYYIRDNKTIVDSDYYCDDVFASTNEKCIFFNLRPVSTSLCIGFNDCGYGEFIATYLNNEFLNILKKIKKTNYEEFNKGEFEEVFLVLELNRNLLYDYYSGRTECDLNVNLVGYLDENMMLITEGIENE